ncbi:MAG TPA: phosphoglucosamine mutase [Pyrinomonadaceae bacterium]|jgi:phosphoglucosamine mutase
MAELFGTDGIRARAGEFPLDEMTVRVIGASLAHRFCERLGRPARFITGRDTRESGEWIERDLHRGVCSAGGQAESASVITTPGVAFLTGCFGFDAGIVISASHNPFEDNGIKVFLPNGRKLDEATERLIEDDIRSGSDLATSGSAEVHLSRAEEFHAAYLSHLRQHFPELRLDALRIVVDCANGAAGEYAGKLLGGFGAQVELLNDSPNGRNINENCGSLHLDALKKAVTVTGADIGVAYDGDADRALFVDEKGNVVDGDATLWVLARRLHDEGLLSGSKVVATVMSNIGLETALQSRGISLIRTAVGDKYVLEGLLKSGAAIGGEQSGHIIFPRKSLVGDGMMTTLFLVDALIAKGRSLSAAVEGFVRFPQILINVRVNEKRPFGEVPGIAAAAKRVDEVLAGTGRLLLRYSGTENLARVMIEGRDQGEIEELANGLAYVIRTELGSSN